MKTARFIKKGFIFSFALAMSASVFGESFRTGKLHLLSVKQEVDFATGFGALEEGLMSS